MRGSARSRPPAGPMRAAVRRRVSRGLDRNVVCVLLILILILILIFTCPGRLGLRLRLRLREGLGLRSEGKSCKSPRQRAAPFRGFAFELYSDSTTLVPCRSTSFIVRSARRRAKSWFVPANGGAPSARTAVQPSWSRSSLSSRRRLATTNRRRCRPAAIRPRPAPTAAVVVAAAARIGTELMRDA